MYNENRPEHRLYYLHNISMTLGQKKTKFYCFPYGIRCGQSDCNSVAKRIPRQWVGVTGGIKRKAPVGGDA
ncbi:hypothetical protein DERP_000121 [Dermatophagoides pteronyssinus]|uniref:Uncharacterized protein n=1 Tax=Dermatophagoides pteronyssinus TaxID=6956 RepID=A0ABQ8IZB1_DERPT|nr:hypothetical protein DERP_000121 [Dermatophagoides pteronyssinus]